MKPLDFVTAQVRAQFPLQAEVVNDALSRIRVTYKVAERLPNRRYSRPIAIHIDEEVLHELSIALDANDVSRQTEIAAAIVSMVKAGCATYDEYGPQDSAHQIVIDDRACDRP